MFSHAYSDGWLIAIPWNPLDLSAAGIPGSALECTGTGMGEPRRTKEMPTAFTACFKKWFLMAGQEMFFGGVISPSQHLRGEKGRMLVAQDDMPSLHFTYSVQSIFLLCQDVPEFYHAPIPGKE